MVFLHSSITQRMKLLVGCVMFIVLLATVSGLTAGGRTLVAVQRRRPTLLPRSSALLMSASDDASRNSKGDDIEETTKKYGLEAGLFKAVTSKPEDGENKVKPQDLLKKYGVAYLATSITLAIISYAICYLLVSNGIDVAAFLEKLGIQSSSAAANTGTAAIAYAVHKAASPIRFPPTVALTPVVADLLGRKPAVEGEEKK